MNWTKVRLGNLIKILSGFAFESKRFNENVGLPIIRIRDILRGYSLTYYDGDYDVKYLIKNGDILIGMDGEFNVAQWKGEDSLLNQRVCKIESFNSTLIDKRYLLHYLPLQLKSIEEKTSFVTVKHLSVKDIQSIEIPLPPLPIQKQIAAILDAADALRRKDQELLKKYDELAQAIFIDMFGDPVKNEKGWEVKRLGDLLYPNEKISYGIVQPGEEKKEGVPVIRVGDFEGMRINSENVKKVDFTIEEKYKKTRLQGDEILIACVGSIGRIALVDKTLIGYNIVRATARIKVNPNIISRYYLAFLLCQQSIQTYFQTETRTVSQPTLNIKQIEETVILVPPVSLQNIFVEKCSSINGMIDIIHHKNSENLFNSLLQKAFKGELVKEEEPV